MRLERWDSLQKSFFKNVFIALDWEEGRSKDRKKHQWKIIDWLPPACSPVGIEPTTQALTRNPTGDLLTLNLSHTGRAQNSLRPTYHHTLLETIFDFLSSSEVQWKHAHRDNSVLLAKGKGSHFLRHVGDFEDHKHSKAAVANVSDLTDHGWRPLS